MLLVWTYSTALEKESPRFSRPGDFFTYIVFLEVFILVRREFSYGFLSLPKSLFVISFRGDITPRIICPPSHVLAEAVPGNEEDHPCILRRSVIRDQSKGPMYGAGLVEVLFENKPTRSSEICVWWLALCTDLCGFLYPFRRQRARYSDLIEAPRHLARSVAEEGIA